MNEYAEVVKAFSPWVTGLAALLGALIGGLINFFTVRWSEQNQAKRDKESLHLALASEVHSIVSIIMARDFEGILSRSLETLKVKNDPKATKIFWIKISPEYRTIYNANASHIGVLDKEDAGYIVAFHQIIHSIVQDVTDDGVLAEGGNAIDYAETLVLLRQAFRLADVIEDRADLPDSFNR